MTDKKFEIIQATSLLSCGFIATQIISIIYKGEAFCLNQGCRIVEELTTISPIYINLAGFIFFLAVFMTSRLAKRHSSSDFNWLGLLLATGLAMEGVLVSYQLTVIQTLCSYCMIIFGIIVLLNIIAGQRQLLLGIPIFLAVFIGFNILNFGSAQIMLQNQHLESGTFAIKVNANSTKQLFLFFSSDCPHCQNVLTAIEGDNNCELNLNPIDTIDSLDMQGLQYLPNYNPALNRLLLSLLDIKTIPVLLASNKDGYIIVKGEGSIINFINESCFDEGTDLYSGYSSPEDPFGVSTGNDLDGECEIEVECPDPVEQSPTTGY